MRTQFKGRLNIPSHLGLKRSDPVLDLPPHRAHRGLNSSGYVGTITDNDAPPLLTYIYWHNNTLFAYQGGVTESSDCFIPNGKGTLYEVILDQNIVPSDSSVILANAKVEDPIYIGEWSQGSPYGKGIYYGPGNANGIPVYDGYFSRDVFFSGFRYDSVTEYEERENDLTFSRPSSSLSHFSSFSSTYDLPSPLLG